jgi:hypothetical protein
MDRFDRIGFGSPPQSRRYVEITGAKRIVALGAVALALATGTGVAGASNSQNPDNPYVDVYSGSHGTTCVTPYKAPPAYGYDAPSASAAGGTPGYMDNAEHGPSC